MSAYHSGWDYFTSDIDKPAETNIKCQVCGTKLVGKQSHGYHSWVAAMAKRADERFVYQCPNVNLPLHEALLNLKQEQEELISPSLQKLVQVDINSVHKALKKQIK